MPTDLVLTGRTRATRDNLLRVARQIFETDGFDATSIRQIADAAGVSRGTFYLYFESKHDVFQTLADAVQADVVGLQRFPRGTDPATRVRESISRFIAFYRDNARMMAVLEHVAAFDESFRPMRRKMRHGVARAATQMIEHLHPTSSMGHEIDAEYAGVALTGMIDRFAYVWFVLEDDFDEDRAVDTLTALWLRAVGADAERTE